MRRSSASGRGWRAGRGLSRGGIVGLSLLLGTQLALIATASASISAGVFELDGNAADGVAPGIDWDEVYEAQTGVPPYGPEDCPAAASACAWESDGALNATIFTGGGSKDPQDISSWKWKSGSGGLPDKDNLLHAFASRFTAPGGTDELLYFGSDRFDNAGDAHQAFWFFQNKVFRGADGTFVDEDGNPATHRDGDLLVISEFSNGGTASTIVVYAWDSSVSGNLRKLDEGIGAKCDSTSNQPFCGIVNSADGAASPWPFLNKRGATAFAQGEFFEGGINLSDPDIDLAGRCFASFASETRSSTSTTAVLKDFVLGGFGECETGLVTTPKTGSGGPIPAGGLSIGGGEVTAKDSAQLTVTGSSTWSGTLSFFICGPIASGLCESGGVAIGNPISVNQSTAQPILSAAATLTSAGRYCWRGEFTSSTSGVPDAVDSSVNECFAVAPVTPTLTTTAGPDVTLGQAVTDDAALSGTSRQPGANGPNATYPSINATDGAPAAGTITFSLHGPGSANCATQVGASSSVNVNGDGTAYAATPVTPPTAGTYYWKAQYGGNSPNTLGTAVHNVSCDVSAEEVIVGPVTPALSTEQSFIPNDSATVVVTNGGAPTGSVWFRLYATDSCTGTPLFDETVALPAGANLSKTVGTSNSATHPDKYVATSGQSLFWKVVFTSTNANHANAEQPCGKERSTLTINNSYAPPPG